MGVLTEKEIFLSLWSNRKQGCSVLQLRNSDVISGIYHDSLKRKEMCLGILSMFNFWKWKKKNQEGLSLLMKPRLCSCTAELRSPSYLLKKFVSYTKHILRKNDEKIQNCLWKLPPPLSHPASTLSNYSFIHSNRKISSSKGFFFQTSFFTQTRFQFYSVAANMKNLRKGSEKGCLRLFLSLSSDKSFNWAHIFKIPAFFLHSRKKIRGSNAAIIFFAF